MSLSLFSKIPDANKCKKLPTLVQKEAIKPSYSADT